jgi:hypothetical protein
LITYKVTNRQIQAEDRRVREQRLADAYVDALRIVRTAMAAVEQVRPHFRMSPEPEKVPPLSFDEEATIKARLDVFGSHVVRELFIAWRGRLNFFRLAVGELNELAGGPELPRPDYVAVADWAPLSREMNESRDQMRGFILDIERQMRKELGVVDPELAEESMAGKV